MVKEIDITQKRIKEKELRDRVKGLIRKVLGEDAQISSTPRDTAHIFVKDSDDKDIIDISRLSSSVTVYIPSYENKAGEIAKGYEKLIGKEVTLETDYSGPD